MPAVRPSRYDRDVGDLVQLFRGPALDAEAHYARGRELEADQPERAVAAYREALSLDADMACAHADLGRLLHESNDLDGAEHCYRAAARLCPDEPIYWFNLGVILEDTDRDARASIAYRAAVALDSAFADAHFNLAGVFERLGDERANLRHLAAYRRLSRRVAS